MKKIIATVVGLLFLFAAAQAQPYYFRHYQVENGLSHNTVYCSAQDKNGFLWFGTKDGLNRFDGYRFKTFTIIKETGGTLMRDMVLSLATDQRGTLWVGTQKGLYRFNAERETFTPFLDSIHGINDIFFDHKGQLWFTADFTVNSYNFETKKAATFPPEWFFSTTSMCESADGTMWFSTRDGYLQEFDAATQTFKRHDLFAHSPAPESKVIQKIVFDKKGCLWVGTNNQGIKEFNLADHSYKDILIYGPNKTTIYVRDILQTTEEETWFATELGIFILNKKTGAFVNLKKQFLDLYSLSDNAVYTLYKDAEGGIWAGTFFGGLNYFPKQHSVFQKFFPDYSQNSISGNAVREICEDRRGNIWIGTEDAGLNKLDPRTGLVTHFGPSGKQGNISYPNIHGLVASGDELWIGTFEHGLDIMDINTGVVKRHYGAGGNGLKNNFIVSLLQTKSGVFYIGTASGAYRYEPAKDLFVDASDVEEGSFVSCLYEDHSGTIWLATHNRGLFFFHPRTGAKGHFQNEPGNENSLTGNSINSIFEDSHQNLWLSMEGSGLCMLSKDRRRFSRYSTRNGLPSDFVFNVLEDDRQTLWITTSKGLVNLVLPQNKITVYTKANGLLNDQFNYNSGYRDGQGNLYFGSVQGMIKFNPDSFSPNHFVPPVYITGLQVQNREMDVTKDSGVLQRSVLYTREITLPYDQSSFSFDFAALSFTSPETTEYSYLMSGLDKEWTYLPGNRKVYFTNLKPGTYTFKVKAGINNRWGQTKEISIVITPPFWATPWAYLFYLAMAVLLAWYLIRSYHQAQESKKEKEIYQAKMEFFTNIAHEIKTPLTLIKGPVENLSEMVGQVPDIKEDVTTMERNTDRLVNLVNQILDFRQTETKGFSLHFSEVNLNEILQEAYDTFQPLAKKKNLHYTLSLPPAATLLMADAEALTKIFHNLFSNAVKYGQAEVHAGLQLPNREEKNLVVEVSNDGPLIPAAMKEKIFEPFFRIRENSKQKGTGLGLALARSLVQLHRGKVHLKESGMKYNVFVVELPYSPLPNRRRATTGPANRIA